MKKFLVIMLAAAMTLSMAACGGKTEAPAPAESKAEQAAPAESQAPVQEAAEPALAAELLGVITPASSAKEELVVAINSDPGTQDPYAVVFGPQLTFTTQAVETLFLYGADGIAVPFLAEGLEYDEGLMGITLKLRQGVKFHDGNEMKANDVLASFMAISETGAGKSFMGVVKYEGIEIIDDYTLHIPLNYPNGVMDTVLTNLFVIEESVYPAEKEANATFTGTGPFVATKWDPGVGAEYEAFEDYWGGAPVIKKMTFSIMKESSVRMIALENGEADVYKGAAANDISRTVAGDEAGIAVWQAEHSQACHFFAFNLNGPLAKDPKVREAISYAVDTNTLAAIGFENVGQPGISVIPGGNWYSPTMDPSVQAYDPEKAKALLAEAGYPDGITLHMVTSTQSQNRVAACELVPDMFKAAGITIDIELMEAAAYTEYMKSHDDYDLYLANAGNLNEPVGALNGFMSRNNTVEMGSSGYFHYQGTEIGDAIDAAMNKINMTPDIEGRKVGYQEFCDILADNFVIIPMADQYDTNLVSEKLHGMFFTPNINFQYAYFE